jgi:hypothetical protein
MGECQWLMVFLMHSLAHFGSISLSTILVGPRRAPALTLCAMSLLDQNLYIYMNTHRTHFDPDDRGSMYSETLATVLISTLCKDPKTKSSFVILVTVAFCLHQHCRNCVTDKYRTLHGSCYSSYYGLVCFSICKL